MREHADEAIEAGEVEPLIIVGIYNTGDRRMAEYTHERDWQMGGGEAGDYGRLMTEDLMPWIAGQYRVRAEREHTGVGGSSLGGLVSLYLGLRYPAAFRQAGRAFAQRLVEPQKHSRLPERARPAIWERPRLWLDVGDQEGRPHPGKRRAAQPPPPGQRLETRRNASF